MESPVISSPILQRQKFFQKVKSSLPLILTTLLLFVSITIAIALKDRLSLTPKATGIPSSMASRKVMVINFNPSIPSDIAPNPLPTKTALNQNEAVFYFPAPISFGNDIAIDLSTSPDMSTDVYGNFAEGDSNPIITIHPTKWDKYICGKTLYWQARSKRYNQKSAIYSSVVCPPIPTPTPSTTPTPTPITLILSTVSKTDSIAFTFSPTTSFGDYYYIDLSTTSDMSSDIYGKFAEGMSGTVVQSNPTQWDKYSCGRTLYWRVTGNNGQFSPIKSFVVCENNTVLGATSSITVPLITFKNWFDPVALEQEYIKDIQNDSGNQLIYQIVNRVDVPIFFEKDSGFKFTPQTYINCMSDSRRCNDDQVNYQKILTDYQICEKVNANEIDELWLWGGPYFGYKESIMAGPGAFYINSSPILTSSCQRKLPIMGFSYERGVSEMIEDLGHRAEATFEKVFSTWPTPSDNPWRKYVLIERDSPGNSGCGSIHFGPNSTKDYDWNNQNSVTSNCEDWINYPNLTGATTQISCNTWGCNDRNYKNWWFSHLPKTDGVTNGIWNNWWKYIIDYDLAVLTIPTPTPINTSTPTPTSSPSASPTPTSKPATTCGWCDTKCQEYPLSNCQNTIPPENTACVIKSQSCIQSTYQSPITLTSPLEPQVIFRSTHLVISWKGGYPNVTDPTRSVSLLLQKPDGFQVGWISFGNKPNDSYNWDTSKLITSINTYTPLETPSGTYQIRVIDYNNPAGTGSSFVLSSSITITSIPPAPTLTPTPTATPTATLTLTPTPTATPTISINIDRASYCQGSIDLYTYFNPLKSGTAEYLNWGGLNEKWFIGKDNQWYYIFANRVPDNNLAGVQEYTHQVMKWNHGLSLFGKNYSSDIFVANVNQVCYNDISQIDKQTNNIALAPTPIATKPCETTSKLLSYENPIDTSNIYLNWGGLNEKWFRGTSGKWYYIYPTSSGYEIRLWNNGLNQDTKNVAGDYYVTPETQSCYDSLATGFKFPI